MAELEKFTDDGVMMLLKHSDRQLKNDSNKDIVEEKKDLNYSVSMEHDGLSTREYYKQINEDEININDNYIYKSLIDNNVFSPTDYPAGWEKVK